MPKSTLTPALKRAQQRYHKRNEERGLRRVMVWIPEDCAYEMMAIAKEMRDEHAEKEAKNG